jgi:putative molybdopterin biosynthesis protein
LNHDIGTGMTRSSSPFRLSLAYKFSSDPALDRLEHPLFEVLESVHQTGSIGKAAKLLGRSYRFVWGQLKYWESELNTNLIVWGRTGKGSELTPQAIQFLMAVSQTQRDLAPQVAHIKNSFAQCVSVLKNISAPDCTQGDELFVVTFEHTATA